MSDILTVDTGERRLLRLFALDLAPEHARFLREPGAAAQLLGVEGLDDRHVEVFPVWDLEELGLFGYLTEGCGISEDQIDREQLEKIQGWVMLVRSSAFNGTAAELDPDQRVIPVEIYREAGVDWSAKPIEAESAKPYSAPRPSPRETRARARWIGFSLFAFVMTIIIGGLLWLVL
ncbi:hypothetical protein [Primorskyibacter sp. S87]|uniref:hypothetical protein n=1 Tax=Primorskyibacter sp. S87 TaxID=3415126 RepID=UPI003C7993A7